MTLSHVVPEDIR